MPSPLIRRATSADIDTLCALGAATFRETYRAISDPAEVDEYAATHFTADTVARWLDRPGAHTLIASLDGAPVGYSHVRCGTPPECVSDRAAVELSRLYLLAAAHRRGVGAALIQAAQDAMVELGGRSAWLGVYERNVGALAFYASRGFTQVGTHAFEFGGRIYADPVLTRRLDGAPARL